MVVITTPVNIFRIWLIPMARIVSSPEVYSLKKGAGRLSNLSQTAACMGPSILPSSLSTARERVN